MCHLAYVHHRMLDAMNASTLLNENWLWTYRVVIMGKNNPSNSYSRLLVLFYMMCVCSHRFKHEKQVEMHNDSSWAICSTEKGETESSTVKLMVENSIQPGFCYARHVRLFELEKFYLPQRIHTFIIYYFFFFLHSRNKFHFFSIYYTMYFTSNNGHGQTKSIRLILIDIMRKWLSAYGYAFEDIQILTTHELCSRVKPNIYRVFIEFRVVLESTYKMLHWVLSFSHSATLVCKLNVKCLYIGYKRYRIGSNSSTDSSFFLSFFSHFCNYSLSWIEL